MSSEKVNWSKLTERERENKGCRRLVMSFVALGNRPSTDTEIAAAMKGIQAGPDDPLAEPKYVKACLSEWNAMPVDAKEEQGEQNEHHHRDCDVKTAHSRACSIAITSRTKLWWVNEDLSAELFPELSVFWDYRPKEMADILKSKRRRPKATDKKRPSARSARSSRALSIERDIGVEPDQADNENDEGSPDPLTANHSAPVDAQVDYPVVDYPLPEYPVGEYPLDEQASIPEVPTLSLPSVPKVAKVFVEPTREELEPSIKKRKLSPPINVEPPVNLHKEDWISRFRNASKETFSY